MNEFEVETKKESTAASADLKQNKPQDALMRYYPRLDQVIAKAIDESKVPIACGKGCSYCCYYKVEAKPVEIFEIVEFIQRKFSPDETQAALNQATKNVQDVKGLSYEEHLATNQKCPFLVDGGCSIYEVRPSKCRNFHSTEVELCKESYEKPTDLSIPNSYNELLHMRANGATVGFENAIIARGFDGATYDLNSAVIEAFENPKLSKRYNKRKRAFLKAKQIEAPE